MQAIEDALTMSEDERRERHRQNYMHVQVSERGLRGRARQGANLGQLLQAAGREAEQERERHVRHRQLNMHV